MSGEHLDVIDTEGLTPELLAGHMEANPDEALFVYENRFDEVLHLLKSLEEESPEQWFR